MLVCIFLYLCQIATLRHTTHVTQCIPQCIPPKRTMYPTPFGYIQSGRLIPSSLPHPLPAIQGGGDFVRGQVRGESFVFQFGVEIFPTSFSFAVWGTPPSSHPFLELVPASVWRANLTAAPRPLPRSSFSKGLLLNGTFVRRRISLRPLPRLQSHRKVRMHQRNGSGAFGVLCSPVLSSRKSLEAAKIAAVHLHKPSSHISAEFNGLSEQW